jgi:hypothetical protein
MGHGLRGEQPELPQGAAQYPDAAPKKDEEISVSAIVVPNTDPESVMDYAKKFSTKTGRAHFTAEELCAFMYGSEFGMGSWIAPKLTALVRRGKLQCTKRRGKPSLYRVTPTPSDED